jgi:hypothetical protein
MAANEMFKNVVRATEDLAGVFEYDGETGYFYLYATKGDEGKKVVAAIQVVTGSPDFAEEDVTIHWDASEKNVGLFIRRRLWAAFDAETRLKYGGSYRANTQPAIPKEIANRFILQ